MGGCPRTLLQIWAPCAGRAARLHLLPPGRRLPERLHQAQLQRLARLCVRRGKGHHVAERHAQRAQLRRPARPRHAPLGASLQAVPAGLHSLRRRACGAFLTEQMQRHFVRCVRCLLT